MIGVLESGKLREPSQGNSYAEPSNRRSALGLNFGVRSQCMSHMQFVHRGFLRLLVCVADGAEESTNYFVVGLELAVVGRLLEHAQVEVRRW
jgi:hypothetical protein